MTKTHNNYWQKRSDDIMRYVDGTDIDMFAELQKIYVEQSAEIQRDLFAFVTQYADDNKISYSDALQRLRGVDLSNYQANAKKYREQAEKDPELLKRLNEQYASSKVTRLDALNLEMTYKIGVMQGVLETSFENYLKSTAKYAYKKAIGGNSGALNEPALKELINTPFNGRNYSQQLWGNTDDLARDLRDVLKRGFIRGDDVRSMAGELAKKYNVARSRAQTLIRTDGTAIINRATIERYKDAGLKYYRISVHLDSRTSDICREISREDKRYSLDEFEVGVTAPPFHYNCRSAVIPDTDEIDEKELENLNTSSYNQDMTDLQSSGAISARRGNIKKQQDAFAERYYNQLRNSKRDTVIDKMSASSGVDKETVGNALSHILDNTYQLWDSEAFEYRDRNFYPHYDMAQSFQRLMLGNPKESDIIMLKHESLEAFYMNEYKMTYDDAHKLANEKYNYQEADNNG
ncbi:phage putative head morphogenesis protein, SPP1 gp7 family [Streptococcus gallolyticus]|uniref:Phage putative head morphogenesis protein, SPP1 gp7 family n=1 Tax=Streptococcus gallolyticus TaxID=315405 RepID=A0A1I7JLL1_9STRE|nr:minor capsid protein [Streptococcus gallolyticus]SFC84699.1 phage putative head morphogenesis protein, SPP1 gp7 family [Streptococcus gallolyticus]SFU86082.1 phage putative head morphogenesis protein, SPP1 gp7 family [Streptococcus gallolyticus]